MSEPMLKYYASNFYFPSEREKLYDKYNHIIETDMKLNRTLVSFQANKKEAFYRWFKYKEGFSKNLINYYLDGYSNAPGSILDPFAGVGATIFAARERRWNTTGIELLPVGIYAIKARLAAEKTDPTKFKKETDKLWVNFQKTKKIDKIINHISITRGAFPKNNEDLINKYLTACKNITDNNMKILFEFAAFCVLEESSYTRKDGQYLRWDSRAERSNGNSSFDKGEIKNFIDAVKSKINEIKNDIDGNIELNLFQPEIKIENLLDPKLLEGTSLEILPKLDKESFNFVFTSPPYLNRYDYTRTYAL
jgi:16S rRNA G966 N2-methylase RsmD